MTDFPGFDERLGALSESVSGLTFDLEGQVAALANLQTQVGTLQVPIDGHTHDCVLQKLAQPGKSGGDDDGRRGIGNRFTVSCGLPTLPTNQAMVR